MIPKAADLAAKFDLQVEDVEREQLCKCGGCGVWKGLGAFGTCRTRGTLGRHFYCKECRKQIRKEG